ncbi:MAG TPA: phytanoyl-CoA dioxygenase family protein [Gemmataceae bacterium]|nr:phytanoyl-CoA dioxygenase family protein [Gemmataceae bacterium]
MSLDADGFSLLQGVFAADEVIAIVAEWDGVCSRNASDAAILAGEGGPAYGARDLLRLWPRVIELARSPRLLASLRDVLGPTGGVVRALFFDKPPGHSWALPWHKDYNVAVKSHGGTGTFHKPTKKVGVPHVEAPEELLSRMVTARIHLDAMTDENGALRVVPGSQRYYRASEHTPQPPVSVHCSAGDVLLMRPLLTHASGHCRPETRRHRRIVHLECAPSPALPDGYEWHDFVPLDPLLC